MRQSGWLILFVAAVAAMWWAGLTGLAVLVGFVGGLAGVAYLVVRTRRPAPLREAERERERRDVEYDVDRHTPPSS